MTTRHRTGMDAQSFVRDFSYHLKHSLSKDKYSATPHDRFLALSYAVRDRMIARWIETQQMHHDRNVKRAYYVSLEFLLGRSLLNNIVNLRGEEAVRRAMRRLGSEWETLSALEADAGLGNGGLGRLAACFLDSLATMGYPAVGYGLRYEFGIFRQAIRNGAQIEEPDPWLRLGNPWEFARPEYIFSIHFGGRCEEGLRWVDTETVLGMPYDVPIVGYGGTSVNTLRLWSARSDEEFDFAEFSEGDYIGAVDQKITAENITKVLYPADRVYAGRELRLRQQYFLVSCTLQDILRRHRNDRNPIESLPEKAAIQMNDTHPSLAVAELMRLLVVQEGLSWEKAWEIVKATIAYTNHTLLPEALEQWPVEMLERLLPCHLKIIYDINQRHLHDVARLFPGDAARISRMSLINEEHPRRVRMAHLAIVGSHSVNGVSEMHTNLLKTRLLPDFNDMFPERFNNKTNGVTPRRWLRMCNPGLSALITEHIGEGWVTDLDRLRGFESFADTAEGRRRFLEVKRQAKESLANMIARTLGTMVDPDSLFDVQVKRLHEYKRQLLNVLHIVLLYQRLRENPEREIVPRTFIFGAKAAPSYWAAKRVIKLIHSVGRALDADPAVKGRLRAVFLPDYRVSLAEQIFPASDLSEQISTAGYEASGTGNMKFALNGALTIGTLDGANIEIRDAVGPENFFIFGLNADEVAALAASNRNTGREVCQSDPEIRRMVDFLFSGHFEGLAPDDFDKIREAILDVPDLFMHLADLRSYADAQERADATYRDPHKWARKAILNVSRMGRFSSDRTVREYARDIWHLEPFPHEGGR